MDNTSKDIVIKEDKDILNSVCSVEYEDKKLVTQINNNKKYNDSIDLLKNESIKSTKIDKEAYLYRLRENSILNWTEDLRKVIEYKELLSNSTLNSTLEVESGIVKINPINRYISHEFVPCVKKGFNFYELSIVMKYKVIEFENRYGVVNLLSSEIDKLNEIVYFFNRTICNLDISDKKKRIHLEQSAIVLYYLLTPSVILKNQVNSWCSLIFTKDNNISEDYCTIFTEEQMSILEKVNNSIQSYM